MAGQSRDIPKGGALAKEQADFQVRVYPLLYPAKYFEHQALAIDHRAVTLFGAHQGGRKRTLFWLPEGCHRIRGNSSQFPSTSRESSVLDYCIEKTVEEPLIRQGICEHNLFRHLLRSKCQNRRIVGRNL